MTDADTIRPPVQQRPQFQPQPQNPIRPNVNPLQTTPRPPLPPSQISGQPPTAVPQQRPAPSPLRRVDSRGNIQVNQFPGQQQQQQQRPVGSPLNQSVRPPPPPSGAQSLQQQQQPPRQQPPSTWAGTVPNQQPPPNQLQQNRPPYPFQNQQPQQQQQQANPQVRPPYQPRPPVQQPVGYPNQTQYRPPYPQQAQQRPGVLPQQPLRNMQNPNAPQSPIQLNQSSFDRQDNSMSSDLNKSNIFSNSLTNNNDDDDDVIMGRASTPLKNTKPIDPMTQSQYGFLDNRSINSKPDLGYSDNGYTKSEDIGKKPSPLAGNLTNFNTNSEDKSPYETGEIGSKPPLPPSGSNLQRNNSRNSMIYSPKSNTERLDYLNDSVRPQSPATNKDKPPMPFAPLDSKPPISLNSIISGDGGTPRTITASPQFKTSPDIVKEAPRNVENVMRNAAEPPRSRPISRHIKGDNDSGVDESTQGNDRNGPNSPGSPLKSPTKIPGAASRPVSTTPSNKSNISRSASRSRTLKTPEPEAVKKVPMNKIQVGHAPSPNLKAVRSKIGSLDNAAYKPGGGNIKIETKKIDIKATPRIEAKNDRYVSKGGDKKIVSTKLQWNAKSKIGSLENAHHKPGGGDKKIETIKADFKDKAKPKVGSKDNTKHIPKGGDIKIQTHKLEIKAQSKIGSMDNVKHKPGGGDKKIFDDKDYLRNVEHPVAPSPPTQSPTSAVMTTSSGADENLNQQQS